ncbi:hypothetical protein [Acinetobacter sp. ANC 3832]|uniref:hypothetical protein n=1 Tax=Acinetobacter sp. ANC 3832 TaxID=1977874 RepID=UPI000A33ACB7|nr:hypothetical protein [Acinetobacter sp. ANC 3832]OTG94751.1 hypothetical protein B9T35_05075 [Acinetobacter sp. ANC 3832]
MMIRNNELYQSYVKIILSGCLVLGSSLAIAKTEMNDEMLAEQTDHLARLTPIVIVAVKEDLKQSTEAQEKVHGQVAKERSDKEKKKEIYTTVLTDYEWQKKDREYDKSSDKYISPIEQYRFIEIADSPYLRHDVRITTADKVTVYLGHERD